MALSAPTKSTALNIGSGARPQGNLTFLFADAAAWPVDVACDLRALPFRDGQFEYVHCSHLIEHIPTADVPVALAELRRVLHRDGILYIAAPDLDRATAAGSTRWVQFTRKGSWHVGWEHLWSCTVRKLRAFLVAAGFAPTWAMRVPQGWPANTHQWPADFESRFLCRRDDFPWPDKFPLGMEVPN